MEPTLLPARFVCRSPLFQRFPDGGGAGNLAVAVEVAVNVGGRVHVAVSEPVLDLLHRSSEREQERSAGMPQVMEADMPQSVLSQDDREMVADVVRTVEFSERVHADVVLVIAAVSLSKRPFHFRLPFPLGKEHLLHHRDQGKRALGRFGFYHVVSVRTILFVQHLMPDVDLLLREVNGRPFQSQHLTSPQSVIGGQHDDKMEFVIGGHAEQFLDLLGIVVARDERLGARPIRLFYGVCRDDPALDRHLESAVQKRVVALCGGPFQALSVHGLIEGVDLISRDLFDLQVQFPKEGDDSQTQVGFITLIGRFGDARAVFFQPFGKVVFHRAVGKTAAFAFGVRHRILQVEFAGIVLFEQLVEPVRRFGFGTFPALQIQPDPLDLPLAVLGIEIDRGMLKYIREHLPSWFLAEHLLLLFSCSKL